MPFVLVGASALGCFLDSPGGEPQTTSTSRFRSNSMSCLRDSIGCRDGPQIRAPSIGG
jgi:hypothetical protein